MANPKMVVRILGDIEALKERMASGRFEIQETTAKMVSFANSYSGARTVQQAHDVQAAIAAVGGVTNLTAKEQAQANRILEEGLAKYQALGREAPAGMRALADETQQVKTHSSGLSDTVKSLALSFAAMFTARAAFNFVASTINEASALKDLAQQTHINVEELQLVAGAMAEFGVDADELGRGLFKLNRGIASGDESVVHGLHLMGLSLKDVDGLQGQELFLKIERGLATLQGGLRDTAAAELYGGKLGAAMAGAAEGIDGAMDKARQLNTVMSTESVDALDEYGESIERAQRSLTSMAANMIGPVAEGFNVVVDAAVKGASKWSIFVAMTKDWAASNSVTGASATHLATLLDHLNQKTDEHKKATAGATDANKDALPVLDARSQAIKFMAALEADSAVKLTASQLTNLQHLKDIGQLTAKNAEGIGVKGAAYAKYTADVERSAKLVKAEIDDEMKAQQLQGDLEAMLHREGLKHFKEAEDGKKKQTAAVNATVLAGFDSIQKADAALRDAIAKASLSSADYQIFKIWDVANEQIRAFKGTLEQRNDFNSKTRAAAQQQVNDLSMDLGVLRSKSTAFFQEQFEIAKRTYQYMRDHSGEYSAKAIADYKLIVDAAEKASKGQVDALKPVKAALEDTFNRATAQYSIGGSLSMSKYSTTGDAASKGATLAQDSYGNNYLKYGSLSEQLRILADFKAGKYGLTSVEQAYAEAGLPIPGRAAGGPVTSGSPYMVGERGPELFIPKSDGTMIPSGGYSGGAGGIRDVHVHVGGHVLGTQYELAQLVKQAIAADDRSLGRVTGSGA